MGICYSAKNGSKVIAKEITIWKHAINESLRAVGMTHMNKCYVAQIIINMEQQKF